MADVAPIGWDADGAPVVEFPIALDPQTTWSDDQRCWLEGTEGEPCYGEVCFVGDDWSEENDEYASDFFACTGHADSLDSVGARYVPPAQPEALLDHASGPSSSSTGVTRNAPPGPTSATASRPSSQR